MREEFEKLPEIAELINGKKIKYHEDSELYYSCDGFDGGFINGAYYAYQEQQKKIEQLLEIINTGLKIEQNMNNQIHSLKEQIRLLEPFAQDILK